MLPVSSRLKLYPGSFCEPLMVDARVCLTFASGFDNKCNVITLH